MRPPKGFTLIELLVTLCLLALLASVATGLFVTSSKSRASQDLTVELQQNTRSIMDLALQEMRSIQTISCLENTDTACAGHDKIIFTSVMLNPDGSPDTRERIFSWTNDPLSLDYLKLLFSKEAPGSPNRQELAKGITEFYLTPYDGNNNATNTLSQVKRIDLKLIARSATIDPLTGSYKYYPITETVRIRNVPYP
jgi:prepilin-type N-terminal cleavage/methylation domain-containing protein